MDPGQAQRHRQAVSGVPVGEPDPLGAAGGGRQVVLRASADDHDLLALGRGQQHAGRLVAQGGQDVHRHRFEGGGAGAEHQEAGRLLAVVVHPAAAEEDPAVLEQE